MEREEKEIRRLQVDNFNGSRDDIRNRVLLREEEEKKGRACDTFLRRFSRRPNSRGVPLSCPFADAKRTARIA